MQLSEALSQPAGIVTGERVESKQLWSLSNCPQSGQMWSEVVKRRSREASRKSGWRMVSSLKEQWREELEQSQPHKTSHPLNRNVAFLKTRRKRNKRRCWGWRESGGQTEEQRDTRGKVPLLVLTQGWPHGYLPWLLTLCGGKRCWVARWLKWGMSDLGSALKHSLQDSPSPGRGYSRWVECSQGTDF